MSVGYWQNADLCVDEWHANSVVADQGAQSTSDVRQLDEKRLDHLVAGYERLLPRSVYDVGGPHQRHPVLGHGTPFVHHFHDLFLALQHDPCAVVWPGWLRAENTGQPFRWNVPGRSERQIWMRWWWDLAEKEDFSFIAQTRPLSRRQRHVAITLSCFFIFFRLLNALDGTSQCKQIQYNNNKSNFSKFNTARLATLVVPLIRFTTKI